MTCPECLGHLDKYTQRVLAGAPIERELDLVREHLDACSRCTEQFKLVMETLEAIDET